MNNEEIMQLISDLRKHFKAKHKNASEEEIDKMILDMFFQMFVDGKMDKDDLVTLTLAMGYEPTEEFLNDPHHKK